jgi:hypothetical protein
MHVMDALERAVLKPDAVDGLGVNNHLRAAWGARDAINALLTGNTEAQSGAVAEGCSLAKSILDDFQRLEERCAAVKERVAGSARQTDGRIV